MKRSQGGEGENSKSKYISAGTVAGSNLAFGNRAIRGSWERVLSAAAEEQLAQAWKVLTIRFVPTGDRLPAAFEEIGEQY